MEHYLLDVQAQLKFVTEQYNRLIIGKQFHYANREENMKFFSQIVSRLETYAKDRITECKLEMTEKQKWQSEILDIRKRLFERVSEEQKAMSKLEEQRIKIETEIESLSKEIQGIKMELSNLQEKTAKAKKEKEYWDTVFWATCWIQFANIGIAIKKRKETLDYRDEVKHFQETYQVKMNRLEELTDQLGKADNDQEQNKQSSDGLVYRITVVTGQISEVTQTLNELREEIVLWNNILNVCSQIEVELKYTNGKIEKVMECFYQLEVVGDLLSVPSTDKFIKGCICKGDTLSVGEKLNQKEYLLSKNRRFVLVMQHDNNLVLYNSEKALWDTCTWGTMGTGYVELDTDGLVSLKGINKKWDTIRAGAAFLIIQDDGNLVAYDNEKKPLWASNTYSYANAPGICFCQMSV